MILPKFKNYLCNTITDILFDRVESYDDNLYSKDSNFEVTPSNSDHDSRENWILLYKEKQQLVDSLSKSPKEEDVLNGDFSFVIKFDSISVGTGLPLQKLIDISKKLHTDLLFVNGDGNDYQISEYTGGHDSEVILHVQFTGNKKDLIQDYKNWYIHREEFLKKKLEAKQSKTKNKRV